MSKEKSAPVVDPVVQSVPMKEAKPEANITPEVLPKSSEKTTVQEIPDPDLTTAKKVEPPPLFNPADVGEPLSNPEPGGELPQPQTEKKGRGRPRTKYANEDEAAEAKRARDRLRHRRESEKGATPQAQAAQPASAPVPAAPNMAAKASAEMVMIALDTTRNIVSSNECLPDRTMREQVAAVWEQYFIETGMKPPTWVLVLITSGSYVAPAFNTPTAQGRLTKWGNAAKSWWVKRFGG